MQQIRTAEDVIDFLKQYREHLEHHSRELGHWEEDEEGCSFFVCTGFELEEGFKDQFLNVVFNIKSRWPEIDAVSRNEKLAIPIRLRELDAERSSDVSAILAAIDTETETLERLVSLRNGEVYERKWSLPRSPKEWRALKARAGKPISERTWPNIRKKRPDDFRGTSKMVQISRGLAEEWNLDLQEFAANPH
ncbi:MAG: hypothetical protein NXI04_16350 [Planctomycetaceae bacterium]|nr:hypothetical protein [Planctomycetaceae bacterium]